MNTRRAARELALLTLSQFQGQFDPDRVPELSELLSRAASMLSNEAQERLKTAMATLARLEVAFSNLQDETEEIDPDVIEDLIRVTRLPKGEGDLEQAAILFWRKAKERESEHVMRLAFERRLLEQLDEAREDLRKAAEDTAAALEWPVVTALAKTDDVRDFALNQIRRYFNHAEEVDQKLDQAAKNWSIDRMASIDRDILRLALAEMLYDPSVPVEVTINEAVELAKRYSTDDSSKFVNGVLSYFASDAQRLRNP